ncbi:helix-turn-helix domain-containing protein [Agathobaculum sp. NTUH-O15-33]|uniref:cupin domain-containing protein n=1 Tax=Agathobaculum sp. NTUH-O15-33 TaxID=3079302 RepID=UPI002958AC5F|nr:cupin domain-containing protein [Agathobaculum sp. NTUH-O15-33]WNX86596.1 helix-turn-helix domain-containing protein [Agathobaculum sp. NTUH-O15-33]
MNAEQKSRGMHLRMCRQKKKMTLQALSELTGLSAGFLSKIENGVGNPSINNIQKICYALGITANELMATKTSDELLSTANDHSSYVLRGNERCLIYNFSDMMRFEAVYEGSPHFKINIMTLSGGANEHYNSIHSYDEFGIISKGTMSVELGDGTKYDLVEGDCIMIRAQTPHTVVNTSPEACISSWVEIYEDPNAPKTT